MITINNDNTLLNITEISDVISEVSLKEDLVIKAEDITDIFSGVEVICTNTNKVFAIANKTIFSDNFIIVDEVFQDNDDENDRKWNISIVNLKNQEFMLHKNTILYTLYKNIRNSQLIDGTMEEVLVEEGIHVFNALADETFKSAQLIKKDNEIKGIEIKRIY